LNVYKEKGCSFTEPVYQEGLEIELEYQEIPFEAQKKLKLAYRGRELKQTFKPDFICYEKIVFGNLSRCKTWLMNLEHNC